MQGGETLRPEKPLLVRVDCAGPCDKATQGEETLQYVALVTITDKKGKKHTVPNPRFTPQGRGRAGEKFTIKLGLFCYSPTGVPGILTRKVVTVKFDRLGQVDYKSSDLNGDGKPDKGQL